MSSSAPSSPRIGVGVIVWRDGCVLLGKRLLADGGYCWQMPGGHLEPGESVIDCALREVAEESGLVVGEAQPAGYTGQQFSVGDTHYITLYVSALWQQGEARVTEPEKCESWQWFPYQRLPSPLFEPISLYLNQYKDLFAACRRLDIPAGEHR